MSKVRFNLRRNEHKDPLIQLIYRIIGDQKKVVIGTGLNVPERFWNKNTMRVRETREFPKHQFYNQMLNRWEESVYSVINRYHLQGKVPSKIQLKKSVIDTMKGNDLTSIESDFIRYFEQFITRREQTQIKKSTIQLYSNALRHLKNFQRSNLRNATLEFEDLDRDFFIKFIRYLGENLEQNTINKVIKQLRTALNDAKASGINVNLDYKLPHTQVSYTKQPKIYLSIDEIEMIDSLDLSQNSRLTKIRDRFMIGVWTGLRFSDFVRVGLQHVVTTPNQAEIIKIRTKKTSSFVSIPIKRRVKEILEKYPEGLPKISEQKFNKYLKELCQIAEINQRVYRVEKGSQTNYEKWELVSSHICRRSFATNSFKAGLHPKLIMPITGHKTIKQFMDYICIDEVENLILASQNKFFK